MEEPTIVGNDEECVEKEFAALDEQSKKEEVYTISDWEIFQTGKWNGENYTVKDLDDMVKSFNEIGGKMKPYLKLGHDEEQKLAKDKGYPALGWVTELKRKGEKLLATVINIPRVIYELIQKKAYGRVSSEIYWNLKDDKNSHRRVLRAVALLGADTPAVDTLDDFINLYTENIDADFKRCTNLEQEQDMELQEQINKLEAEIKEFQADREDMESKLQAEADKNVELAEEILTIEHDRLEKEVTAYFEKQVTDGKILPAQVDNFIKLSLNDTFVKFYTEGGEEIENENFDLVKAIVDSNVPAVEFDEKSEYKEIEVETGDEHELLDKKAMKYMKENDCDYKTALIAVEGA